MAVLGVPRPGLIARAGSILYIRPGVTARAPQLPRGARRRQAILDATLRVLRDAGLGGVTHRSVAAEAGVSVALTTYHFASKDDLLEQALAVAAAQTTDDLRRRAEALAGAGAVPAGEVADRLAELLLERMGDDRLAVIAVFELYVAAARRPPLQAAMAAWSEAYLELVEAMLRQAGTPNPRQAAEIVVAVLDGLSVAQLATPADGFGDELVRPALERLLTALHAVG